MEKLIWEKDYINKIICGDCLEVMKGIPDESVDLVVTDPPYFLPAEYCKIAEKRLKSIPESLFNQGTL